MDEEKLNKIYEIFEKPLVGIVCKIEMNGVKIDIELSKKIVEKFSGKIKKIEKEIFLIAKKEFNIGSPKQLGEIIYNELKIANLKKQKKVALATNAKILKILLLKDINFLVWF